MRKLFLLTLALVMLCAAALAAEKTISKVAFTYVVLEDGTAEIRGLSGGYNVQELVIPEQLDGHPVTRIDLDPHLTYFAGVTTITIPDSVVEIGSCPLGSGYLTEIVVSPDHPVFTVEGDMLIRREDRCLVACAFGHAGGVLEIPPDVTDVADGVFAFCWRISAFTVPENHQTLEAVDGALYSKGDHRLIACPCAPESASFAVQEGTEIIGDYAFANCSRLTKIVLPDSVSRIGAWAFSGCSGLTEFTIPDNVTDIGNGAFVGCSGLTRFIVSPEQTHFAVIDGVLYRTADRCLVAYPPAKSENRTVPSDGTVLSEMPEGSFRALIGVVVYSIEALYGFDGEETRVTSGLTSIQSFEIPQGIARIGDYAFAGCDNLTGIIVPDSVTSIGEWAFYSCSGLTSITLLGSVTSIGEWAFVGCSGLTSVTLPDSVMSIGDWAFAVCSGLTSVMLPDSVTSIGEGAFVGCSGLTSVSLPDSVTNIGEGAFANCSGLSRFIVSPEQKHFAVIDGVLYRTADRCLVAYPPAKDGGSASFEVPQGIEHIAEYAFYDCSGLMSVTLPNSVTSIGDYGFYSCRGLTSVTIPDSVTSIGEDAFYGCDNLTITVTRGSYAAAYVRENGLPYQYTDAMDWLTGPQNQ